MVGRKFAGAALLSFFALAGCGGDDSVSFGGSAASAGTGATGGSTTGGTSAGGAGGATGGAGGITTGGTGGATGGTGGATGGAGGITTGGTGGTTGGAGGTTGGTGGATGGAGGTGATSGTGGAGGCNSNPDCNDKSVCTTDQCTSGTCSHTAIDIDDNDACTTDSCDPVAGVKHAPIDPDDKNPCTLDLCSPSGGVSHPPEILLFSEDFADNSKSWTLGTEWQLGPAVASTGASWGGNDPSSDHSPSADNKLAGVVIGGFPAKSLHGFYYLESPAIDITKVPVGSFVELRFWRWLCSDYDPFMHSRIEVWDGVQWAVVWSTANQPLIDAPPRGNGWYPMSFDVTAYKNAGFKVRFGFDVGDVDVYSVGGWSIDDVQIVASPIQTDTDQCTATSCGSSGAVFTKIPTDDGVPCTVDSCTTTDGLSHVTKTRIFFEDFADNSAGWNLGTQWQIAPAQSSGCGSSSCGGNDPSSDHTSSTSDNGVAGVVVGGCTGTSVHGDYCITSPSINTSDPGAVTLGYWRHLHADYPPYMNSHVDVSNNGGSSWTAIWTGPGACVNDSSWTSQTFDVTAYKASNFRVRFCYSVGQAPYDGGGWSIDDVSLYDPGCLGN